MLMALVQIEETELAALKERCADLEARIQRVISSAEMHDGAILRLHQRLAAGDLLNLEFMLNWWKSVKFQAGPLPGGSADRETLIKDLQQDVAAAVRKCNELEDDWQAFSRDHSEAAARILQMEEENKSKALDV